MTVEEAIKNLKEHKSAYTGCVADAEANETLDIAIRSLEAWKNVQKEIYSQIDALDEIHEFRDKKAYFKALDIINKYLKEVGGRMTKDEIKQVLQEIKDDCSERNICKGCYFAIDDFNDVCALQHMPDEWKLNKIKPQESEDK